MAKWVYKENVRTSYTGIRKNLNPVLLAILANRGITGDAAVDDFLSADSGEYFAPESMKGMDAAVKLVSEIVKSGKRIMVVGDYDVDGIIGAYILYTALLRLGADAAYRIPHRITDGYGINDTIINEAINERFDMLITCDNGISAYSQIKDAVEAGITVIITDHHEIPETLPPADVILNPKQIGCSYPNKQLCGAGVAWKLATALFAEAGINSAESERYIEYAAVATVCDIVDLTGENRTILKDGLKMITKTQNIGMKALINESGLAGKPMTAYALGFIIGPAINATGRLVHAKLALELLISESAEKSAEIAKELRDLNRERQRMTEDGVISALKDIEAYKRGDDKVVVVYLPEMHESIAGIVAGRLKDKLNRPVFIITDSRDGVKGSGRSIEAYDMNAGLTRCSQLLDKFGGHPMAAGFSLKTADIEELRNCLNSKCGLSESDFEKKLNIDMKLTASDINEALAEDLELLEPHGKANPQPVFEISGATLSNGKVVGAQSNVVKFDIHMDGSRKFNGIYFGTAQEKLFGYLAGSAAVDLAVNLKINEYKGIRTLQMTVVDFKSANSMEK